MDVDRIWGDVLRGRSRFSPGGEWVLFGGMFFLFGGMNSGGAFNKTAGDLMVAVDVGDLAPTFKIHNPRK
jgi:hypothetical protein